MGHERRQTLALIQDLSCQVIIITIIIIIIIIIIVIITIIVTIMITRLQLSGDNLTIILFIIIIYRNSRMIFRL